MADGTGLPRLLDLEHGQVFEDLFGLTAFHELTWARSVQIRDRNVVPDLRRGLATELRGGGEYTPLRFHDSPVPETAHVRIVP